jgi:hypothetical protein
LSIPAQKGVITTPLAGALDSSVHVVALYSATSAGSSGSPGVALGQVKLTSLSPRSICYFDLRLSAAAAAEGNVTGVYLQDAGTDQYTSESSNENASTLQSIPLGLNRKCCIETWTLHKTLISSRHPVGVIKTFLSSESRRRQLFLPRTMFSEPISNFK